MKPPQFYITVALSAACLVMSVAVIWSNQTNQRLQLELQREQDTINQGQATLQVGQNLLKDLAEISMKDDKIKQVLARNGYTVNVNASPSPSPSK